MNLLSRILRRSVSELVRIACILALIGLLVMCYSVLSPGALPVIGAMTVGHAIGGGAVACYLLAVIIDEARRPRGRSSLPPAATGHAVISEAPVSARLKAESGSSPAPRS